MKSKQTKKNINNKKKLLLKKSILYKRKKVCGGTKGTEGTKGTKGTKGKNISSLGEQQTVDMTYVNINLLQGLRSQQSQLAAEQLVKTTTTVPTPNTLYVGGPASQVSPTPNTLYVGGPANQVSHTPNPLYVGGPASQVSHTPNPLYQGGPLHGKEVHTNGYALRGNSLGVSFIPNDSNIYNKARNEIPHDRGRYNYLEGNGVYGDFIYNTFNNNTNVYHYVNASNLRNVVQREKPEEEFVLNDEEQKKFKQFLDIILKLIVHKIQNEIEKKEKSQFHNTYENFKANKIKNYLQQLLENISNDPKNAIDIIELNLEKNQNIINSNIANSNIASSIDTLKELIHFLENKRFFKKKLAEIYQYYLDYSGVIVYLNINVIKNLLSVIFEYLYIKQIEKQKGDEIKEKEFQYFIFLLIQFTIKKFKEKLKEIDQNNDFKKFINFLLKLLQIYNRENETKTLENETKTLENKTKTQEDQIKGLIFDVMTKTNESLASPSINFNRNNNTEKKKFNLFFISVFLQSKNFSQWLNHFFSSNKKQTFLKNLLENYLRDYEYIYYTLTVDEYFNLVYQFVRKIIEGLNYRYISYKNVLREQIMQLKFIYKLAETNQININEIIALLSLRQLDISINNNNHLELSNFYQVVIDFLEKFIYSIGTHTITNPQIILFKKLDKSYETHRKLIKNKDKLIIEVIN